ncbi:MAG: cytochrome ubiquinol oxidase subunit I, partial [Bryobacteraceae bacterium]
PVPRPRQNRRPFFVGQLPSVPKNAISLNHRYLKVFTNSCGEPFLRLLVAMAPSGIVATLGGWYLAETGRQPWVIFGVLRTADAISPVPAGTLLSTLIAFICIYAFFMTAFLVFVLRIIRRGPDTSPDLAEASGSLKNALRPHVLNCQTASAVLESH